MKKKVAVISTGGTIASKYDPVAKSMTAAVDAAGLVEALPRRDLGCEVVVESLMRTLSFNLRFANVLDLAARLRTLLADDEYAGAVVTQGTDTLEESSYLLDLLVDTDKPVILTGAQLAADHPQSDGPRNLADAITAAASGEMIGCGVLVCFNGQLHAARDVTKLHTSAVETFTSLYFGHLGIVDDDRVVRYRTPRIRAHYPVQTMDRRVPLVKVVMDIDTVLLESAVDAGVDGIVLEAFGRGNVVETLMPGIGRAIDNGIPVVLTSRCILGRVKPIYGTGGGGRQLEELGVIFASDLQGPKARILLLALLSAGISGEALRDEFQRNAP